MSDKVAIVTGVTGHGAHLAELMLQKGCRVHGLKHDPRRSTSAASITCCATRTRLTLAFPASWRPDRRHQPDAPGAEGAADRDHDLAAQSHVQVRFETPEHTANPRA
jgi:GDP-D-mannose dehydratase